MRWKYIEGYGEKYRIYENGTVVSYSPRYLFDGDKKRIADYEPHILNPWRDYKGYLRVGLYDEKGKVKSKSVHRIVAEAFLPNPEGKECVCHRDNNKENNAVENLYWGTNLENQRQAWADGLKESVKSPVVQITREGEWVKVFCTIKEAAEATGVNRSNISGCARGIRPTAGGYRWQYFAE